MLFRYLVLLALVTSALHAQVQGGIAGVGAVGGRGGRGPAGQPGMAPPPPPATDCAASGTVVNAMTGQPIPRAMVSMNGGMAGSGAGSATDSNGQWTVSNLTCGRLVPSASRIGFINSTQVQALAGSPQVIQLVSGTPVRDIRISLMPEAIIAGKVQDRNGEPLPNSQIRVLRVQVQNGVRTMVNNGGTSSDAQGNFWIGRLTAGRYVVCASSNDVTYPVGGGTGLVYQEDCYPGPASTGVANAALLEGGREMRASLMLQEMPGVHVRGTVNGVPVTGPGRGSIGNVQMQRQGGGRGTQINPDGSFDFPNVPPGSYILRANFPVPAQPGETRGIQDAATAQVEVRSTDINGIVLDVKPPGALAGTIRFELSNSRTGVNPGINLNMNPVPVNGMVFGGPPGEPQWDAAHLGFTFPQVQPGQYRMNVNSPGAYLKSMTLRGQDILGQPFAVEGNTGPIEIVMSDDSGDLDVTVTDKDGQPAAGGVILKPSHGQAIMIRLGDTGHGTRKGLPSGDYKVWAFDDVTMVPWAEDDWMTRYAGPSEKITIANSNNANLTIKRTAAPKE